LFAEAAGFGAADAAGLAAFAGMLLAAGFALAELAFEVAVFDEDVFEAVFDAGADAPAGRAPLSSFGLATTFWAR
jgi:hypothetical protein